MAHSKRDETMMTFSLRELVILRDAVAILSPGFDDEDDGETSMDLCDRLEERLNDRIKSLEARGA